MAPPKWVFQVGSKFELKDPQNKQLAVAVYNNYKKTVVLVHSSTSCSSMLRLTSRALEPTAGTCFASHRFCPCALLCPCALCVSSSCAFILQDCIAKYKPDAPQQPSSPGPQPSSPEHEWLDGMEPRSPELCPAVSPVAAKAPAVSLVPSKAPAVSLVPKAPAVSLVPAKAPAVSLVPAKAPAVSLSMQDVRDSAGPTSGHVFVKPFKNNDSELHQLLIDELVLPYVMVEFLPQFLSELAGGLLFAFSKKDGGIRPLLFGSILC